MSKVSVVISIYNVKDYMEKSIRSVVEQTEKDIEIILVDDGSTDGSGEVCERYAECDSRVQVVHKKNGGLSSARNAGIAVAKSEYILLVDGDDYLRRDAVERLLEVAERYPSDFIQFRYQEVTNEEVPKIKNSTEYIYQVYTSKELFEQLYALGGVGASACTKLFRKSLLNQIPFECIAHEDEMWCTKAFKLQLTVTYISDELYYYVMRDNSFIHEKFNDRKIDIFKVMEERIYALLNLKDTDLLGKEYQKMFFAILRLDSAAKKARNFGALNIIKDEFYKKENEIRKYAHIRGKYALLLNLMCINYNFIYLYRIRFSLK